MRIDKEQLGGRVREVRKGLGLGQLELGQKIGTSKQAISSYEKGRTYPPLDFLATIGRMANVSLDWLITGQEHAQLPQAEDYRLKEIAKAWGLLPDQARKELYNRARELAEDHFPYAEEADQRFGQHTQERAWFIQEKAFEESEMSGVNMQVTRGMEEYLAGELSDGQFYRICREEAQRLEEMVKKRLGKE